MDRYQYNKKLFDENNKQYISTMLLVDIPLADDDIYILAHVGSRLDIIADNYYGDQSMWYILGHVNNIYNTLYIKEETQLRIPSLESINNFIANTIIQNNF